jgi:hypothetical protein
MEIHVKRRLTLLAGAMIVAMLPLKASITYTCDSNIDATLAGTCAALNGSTVSGVYSSLFGNANADIYIQYGVTGIGSSSFNLTSVPYIQYFNALVSEGDTTALASLTSADPLLGSGADGNIDVTAALANALNLGVSAETAGIEADGKTSCTLGAAGCYNGVITILSGGAFAYPLSPSDPTTGTLVDFFSVVEHETDEILGTVSCIGTNSVPAPYDQCGSTDASPADLFRYASVGVPSFLSTANGTVAYFSINGGVTPIAYYNNSPNAQDYGDWASGVPYKVQDAEASPGITLDITTDGGSEISVLDAVGFSQATPEPGTVGLVGVSLGVLALARRLRRRIS